MELNTECLNACGWHYFVFGYCPTGALYVLFEIQVNNEWIRLGYSTWGKWDLVEV